MKQALLIICLLITIFTIALSQSQYKIEKYALSSGGGFTKGNYFALHNIGQFAGGEVHGKNYTIEIGVLNSTDSIETSVHDLQNSSFLISNYPNPASNYSRIYLRLLKEERLDLQLMDMTGKEIRSILKNKTIEAGEHYFELDATDLTSGIYMLYLNANGRTRSCSVIIAR